MQKIKLFSDIILPAFWLYFIFAFAPDNNPGKKNIDKKLADVKTEFPINKNINNINNALLFYIKK